MHRLIGGLVLALVCAMPRAAGAQPPPDVTTAAPTIVTTGEAIVRRVPDQAWVTAAVESRAKTPGDAQRQNAAAMAAVQQRLIGSGVPKANLRTLGYTVQQEIDYVNGRRVPREYVARNALEVRLDDVSATGDVLDAAIQAGATSIAGVRFDLKDRAGAEREALRLAVVDARARADALAAGAGQTIDRVLRIVDTRQSFAPAPRPMAMARAVADSADSTPAIEPGVVEIHAQAQLTVAIR
jgi:uncharacterized protein YggE